jgi:hypothetical protein
MSHTRQALSTASVSGAGKHPEPDQADDERRRDEREQWLNQPRRDAQTNARQEHKPDAITDRLEVHDSDPSPCDALQFALLASERLCITVHTVEVPPTLTCLVSHLLATPTVA